jgi:hypothetical protein
MTDKRIFIGQAAIHQPNKVVEGKSIEIDGEDFSVIENYDEMPPFFMTIVSDSDHWMYLSSKGSLTAGRANPEQAIFPYYTDDKIHDAAETTGNKTIMLVEKDGKANLWEPFSNRFNGAYSIKQNLYKNVPGNKIIFEEVNLDLGLTFRYSWINSDRFGWIRKSSLFNKNGENIAVGIIDGVQNILPYGVQRNMQATFSTLVDAYKKSELVEGTSLALFRMSSIPVDRAEPSEALKVTTVWSTGLPTSNYLVSNRQLDAFSRGEMIQSEHESRGIKGAYFVHSELILQPNESQNWYIVAEVSQDASKVAALINLLEGCSTLSDMIEADVAKGTETLISLVAASDGIQATADRPNVKRHFSNTLFNIMRGGIPNNEYRVEKSDFVSNLTHFNRPLVEQMADWISALPASISYFDLITKAEENGDCDLIRLTIEYLPLKFSRRHGDPSRPWNLFDIKLKNSDGSPSLYYQGNWRDIFQNWEALALSYPEFLSGFIAKFVNASTIDGYNPYKVTRDGFDWELMDPTDPWSNIGYWGDHQIIYLEKLLELSERFFPGTLEKWFSQPIFTYAAVPYRHKPYQELLKSPRDTIRFDKASHIDSEDRVAEIGADGKLLFKGDTILKVNFTEKLLVPLLSKLSNFVPGAGIWMNTQRPEWNDANNALVGFGASMVTVYYMRRYVSFLINLFESAASCEWEINDEVKTFFIYIDNVFNSNLSVLEKPLDNTTRKKLADELGEAGSAFREEVYNSISGLKEKLGKNELLTFLKNVRRFIDHSIQENRRPDGLYHAYNLILFSENEIGIRHLYEMLEGQVALLSSGFLSPEDALKLLDTLRESSLYRADQRSFILYPDRQLPLFIEKNNLTESQIEKSKLLKLLVANDNSQIISKDINGAYHFNGSLNNAETLEKALGKIDQDKYGTLLSTEKQLLLDLYEQIFDHQSFTGRSGTFYKYEGLGCIYWHMVSKLLLTVGENMILAENSGADNAVLNRFRVHYDAIREGIGSHKKPSEYGAFPTDPYSHTPSMAGVQQPGMTGQVKEDLLSRLIELGVRIENGQIAFMPINLKKVEFIFRKENPEMELFLQNNPAKIEVEKPALAFTLCGVPVFYQIGSISKIDVYKESGVTTYDQLVIDAQTSRSVFQRKGIIKSIIVSIEESSLV